MREKILFLSLWILGPFFYVNASIVMNTETSNAALALGAFKIVEVKFDSGQASLPQDRLAEIATVVNEARGNGEIDEVKVISWADRETPSKGTRASDQAVKLADDRAEYLKKYVRDNLRVGGVSTYNMAKRATPVQDFLNTPTAKLKRTLETTGAAPTSQDDTGLFGFKSKSSSGLVLVYLK